MKAKNSKALEQIRRLTAQIHEQIKTINRLQAEIDKQNQAEIDVIIARTRAVNSAKDRAEELMAPGMMDFWT